METTNYRHDTATQAEAEITEYKTIARRELRDIFSDVLEGAELESKLRDIDNVQFVTPKQMEEIVKANPQDADADGLMHYEISETGVKRIPIIVMGQSRANTLHSLLHESVHLMSPKPVFVTNPIAKPDDQTFSDYVGGYRYERFRNDPKSIDSLSTAINHKQRSLFWEAVTDWIAADDKIFSDEELKEIENSGYFERHMINYLLAQCPDDQGLFRALRESYVQGSEDPLRLFLQKQTGTQDDQMYKELLKILGKANKDQTQVNDWKAVVNRYFKTT